MPLRIVRNDITKMSVDAIVNAANESLLGGGGVDGSIHRAAGPGLLQECRTLGGCKTGEAKATNAYNLPCRYVIHTVGPVYFDGSRNEAQLLRSCYLTSLAIARRLKCESVAFPLISAGAYGYPKDEALRIATEAIGEFLLYNDMTVFLVVFDRASYQISEGLFVDIARFIDDRYVNEHRDSRIENQRRQAVHLQDSAYTAPCAPHPAPPVPYISRSTTSAMRAPARHDSAKKEALYTIPASAPEEDKTSSLCSDACPATACEPSGLQALISESSAEELENMLREIDESFSQMVIRKIDEKGIKDSECYKKANIDRKLFSKIRSNIHYNPSKPTAIALAIALELDLNETQELLRKAGLALSHSNKFDLIIEYFITRRIYNIFTINEALFAFDQSLLGA